MKQIFSRSALLTVQNSYYGKQFTHKPLITRLWRTILKGIAMPSFEETFYKYLPETVSELCQNMNILTRIFGSSGDIKEYVVCTGVGPEAEKRLCRWMWTTFMNLKEREGDSLKWGYYPTLTSCDTPPHGDPDIEYVALKMSFSLA